MSGTILVTGAGGFIGGRMVESLLLRPDGYRVIANLRRWSAAARLGRFPAEFRVFDLADVEATTAGLAGVDYVVHCAAGAPASIVEGTRNVLEAARRQGVRRVVHLSSIAVYDRDADGPIAEDRPLHENGDPYGDAKVAAERLCAAASAAGLEVVILRPTIVYGPFSTSWTISVCESLTSGNWRTLGEAGEGTANLVYVDDVVAAARLALTAPAAPGEAFNVNGPEALTWNEYFSAFNAAIGRPPLEEASAARTSATAAILRPAQAAARFAVAHFGDTIMKVASRFPVAKRFMRRAETALKTRPNPAALRLYRRQAGFPTDRAAAVLGYAPAVDVSTGLDLTVQWLRHHRYV